jgi:hypothetical protein
MSQIIHDLLDNLIDGNSAAAQENFEDAMSVKITDALDARKLQVAQQMGANHAEVQAD